MREDAEERWTRGIMEYRAEGEPFRGDPMREGYEEALDALNYAAESRRQGRVGRVRYGALYVCAMALAMLFRED